jgi:hypothetical protein
VNSIAVKTISNQVPVWAYETQQKMNLFEQTKKIDFEQAHKTRNFDTKKNCQTCKVRIAGSSYVTSKEGFCVVGFIESFSSNLKTYLLSRKLKARIFLRKQTFCFDRKDAGAEFHFTSQRKLHLQKSQVYKRAKEFQTSLC